jgi:hypothetical protein
VLELDRTLFARSYPDQDRLTPSVIHAPVLVDILRAAADRAHIVVVHGIAPALRVVELCTVVHREALLAAASQGEMYRISQGELRALCPQPSGTLDAQTLGGALAHLLDGGGIAR